MILHLTSIGAAANSFSLEQMRYWREAWPEPIENAEIFLGPYRDLLKICRPGDALHPVEIRNDVFYSRGGYGYPFGISVRLRGGNRTIASFITTLDCADIRDPRILIREWREADFQFPSRPVQP